MTLFHCLACDDLRVLSEGEERATAAAVFRPRTLHMAP